MRKLILVLAAAVHGYAAIWYVSSPSATPAGSDSNAGTSASAPWATLAHAVNPANGLACGDTVIIVANAFYAVGDANLPYFQNCGQLTFLQSSAWNQFSPIGYRTNPANDSAIYGKLSFAGGGLAAKPTVWSTEIQGNSFNYSVVSFNGNTVTLNGSLLYTGLGNGYQVEFEPWAEGSAHIVGLTPPSGLTFKTHYCVTGYSGSSGANNATFQLLDSTCTTPVSVGTCATAGCFTTVSSDQSGSCTGWTPGPGTGAYNPNTGNSFWCNPTGPTWQAAGGFTTGNYINVGVPINVNVSANTLTMYHSYGGNVSNGMRVSFSTAGFNSFGTLPAPLQLDQIYYVVACSGCSGNTGTFQLALTPGGTPIVLTSSGAGMISMASADLPYNWVLRGLELLENDSGSFGHALIFLGNGNETSQNAMAHHFEVDHCYAHDTSGHHSIVTALVDNSQFLNIHDSWITGADDGEAQAISGTASMGPTSISNNFLEAAGEVTLYGGAWSPYSPPNANKLFAGNYFYKAPTWRVNSGAVAMDSTITGTACLYDTADPGHSGGEWFNNTTTTTNFRCNSSGVWATTLASFPTQTGDFKNHTEQKNGRLFSYIGNLYRYGFAYGQPGEAWKISAETGSGPGFSNDHILYMNNYAVDVFKTATRDTQCNPQTVPCLIPPGSNSIVNNLVVTNPLVCGTSFASLCGFSNQSWQMEADGPGQAIENGPSNGYTGDLQNHNTIWQPDSWPYTGNFSMIAAASFVTNGPWSPLPDTTTFMNSITVGDFVGQASLPLASYYQNSYWSSNALKGATGTYPSPGSFGSGNVLANAFQKPADNTVIKFTSCGTFGGDCHLTSSSPYSAANGSATQLSSDGTDLGADIDVINQATSGVAAGTPPWNIMYGLLITPGTTTATVQYNAPSTSTCTIKVYSSIVRNASGQPVVSQSDSGGAHDGLTYRTVTVTGLSSGTNYNWITVGCGSILMMQPNVVTH